MQDNNYLPVNWIDGMKINRNHFIAQDNAVVFHLAQVAGSLLNDYNYGLLPTGNGSPALKLFLSTDNQQRVQVRIQQCRAITAGGYYFDFREDTALSGSSLQTPLLTNPIAFRDLKNRSSLFYVVLTVNPYKRVPFGAADPTELPPRIPFIRPFFSVDLVPVEEITRNKPGGFQLTIGKVRIEETRAQLEEAYIPPCQSISSHNDLLEIHAALEQFLGKMEVWSIQILQKIFQKKQANDLSTIVQKLCEQFNFFTATRLAELKTTGIVQPPVWLVTTAASMARLMKNVIDPYQGSSKEELINYFTEWCNISQAELDAAITGLTSYQYDHHDINSAVDRITVFTRIISQLFNQLSRLEYIGKRKDTGIFVKEEVVSATPEPQAPKRRSFLAD
jgi:hypothetical protein